jgi:hypothetical protein
MTEQSIIEQERKDFETWYQSQYSKKIDFKRYAPNSFHYDNEDIQENYETWIGCLEYYRHASRQSSQSEPVAEVFWLYELEEGKGIYQGCKGEDSEKDIRAVVASFENAGEPFKVSAAPHQEIPSGIIKAPEHAEIYVSDGLYALVDWQDFNTVKGYKWNLTTRNRTKNVSRGLYAQAWSTENVSTRKRISMHRLIMPDAACIDHINGNGLDNRRANLRSVTMQQNSWNMASSRGSSIYKGVSFDKEAGLWRSYIRHDNKRLHLGKFENEIDAAIAYDSKAKELFGEYANTNF